MKGDRLTIAAGAGLMAVAATLLLSDGSRARPAIRLLDTDGRVVTGQTLSGHWTMLYFGETGRSDLCPATIGRMLRARDRLGARSDFLRPVFVTTDPVRDTPAKLAIYAKAFSPALVPLTGSPDGLARTERAFGLDTGMGRRTQFMYVLDPSGRLVATIPGDLSEAELAKRLAALVG